MRRGASSRSSVRFDCHVSRVRSLYENEADLAFEHATFGVTDMQRPSLTLVLFTAALTALAACSNKQSDAPPATAPSPVAGSSAPTTAPVAPAAPAAAKLTDSQIAAIVVAANQVDVDAGQLALKKSKNKGVQDFAQRMVTDHTAVNKAAVDLVTKLEVTPEETTASKALTKSGAETLAKLAALEGADFDRAYVENEVAYHKAVIGVLESELIPSATNHELKDALVGVKPAFDAHLKHAEQMQAALAGDKSARVDHAAHGK
jgi:putative membrane protein